ncbi:CRTAC1 family protein [Gemmatirosa kalamazoonensis]|nr:CRTAC1 family protein [Gemmatirosa kalamazoonensis]
MSAVARAALLALLALACAPRDRTAASAPNAPAVDGTRRMADTLAAIAARARTSSEPNPFLNRERVASLRGLIAFRTGRETFSYRNWIADELLKAGQTREAIDEIKALLRDAGETEDSVTAWRKPVFDLLAIANLRLGEQENCLANPSANVCILPLDGTARHTKQDGTREAIRRYTQILHYFPDDYGSRYLLNLAWLAVGGYPDSVPPRFRVPGLAPRPNDPFPRFPNVAPAVGLAVTGLAGGLSIDDFDGDGLLDVFTTSWGPNDPVHLFIADGRGGYVDRAAAAGLKGIVGGLNTVHADYDNDGDVDILVLRGAWLGEDGRYPPSLLRNRGDGTFEDVTFAAGLASFHPSQTAAWADFDRDGWLDLFVGAESGVRTGGPSHRSELYRNNHDGTFTEVSHKVGIDLDDFVKGAVWGDVNNDGLPDLFVSVFLGPNRLYVNRGGRSIDTWRFEEQAAVAGVQRPIQSFPTWFFDYDNDGWDDLLVLSYDLRTPLHDMVAREMLGKPLVAVQADGRTVPFEPSRLYHNRGDGTFEDVTRAAGLEDKVMFAMGSNFGDLDNDGWLDFYVGTGNPDLRSVVPNRMFHNVAGRRFEEVSLPGGFAHIQKGHPTAFADLDRDGDEDVFMVIGGAYQGDTATSVLFENPGWPKNAWITLSLEGRAANRSAIGARVEVVAVDAKGATRTVRRTVGTGGSFGSGSLQLHVGLGPATAVRTVRVVWPDAARTTTTYENLAVDRAYHIVQGTAPVALDRPPVPFREAALGAPVGAHAHP